MTAALPPLHPARWVLACLLLAATAAPAPADDRGLLRTATQTPYVFIILDTSGSMAELPNGNPAAANADDPSSKLYSAKRAAYNVFSSVANVNFGFASFQQDALRVIGKHWLYTAAAGTTAATAGFPVPWPKDGEQWVFGTFFPAGTTGPGGTPVVATPGTLGGCPGSGIALSTFQSQLDRFPKLQPNDDSGTHIVTDSDSSQPTVMYIASGGKTYAYTVSRQPNTPNLGDATIAVQVNVVPCTGTGNFSATLTFNLGAPGSGSTPSTPGPFLMNETAGPTSMSGVCSDTQAVCSDQAPCAGKKATCLTTGDDQNGYWNYSDVLQSWAGGGLGNGLSKQSSGMGWEGNYDGTYTNPPLPTDAIQGRQADAFNTGYDPYTTSAGCAFSSSGTAAANCPQNLKQPTTIAPPIAGLNLSTAALDTGDLLPMNWNNSNQAAFLSRMAPNQAFATPDFTQADYFLDFPDSTGYLPLKDPGQIPLLAAGPTPLGGSVIDFRCWYIGDAKGGSKCSSAGNFSAAPWQPLANTESSGWGCAKPFLILITDGNDTFGSPDPGADVANLKNKSAPSVQTWVIDYGGDCAKAGNPIHSIVQVGKGQCINASDPSSLQAALQQILGLILEQTRAFATAAVPSVQATSADKIYLSDFTPTGGTGLPGTVTGPNSTWEGHLNAFLKPLLSDASSRICANLALNDQSDCFLWDGGAQMVGQVPAAAPLLGTAANERRIFYSMLATNGSWSEPTCGATGKLPCRRLLIPTVDSDDASIRYDLWTAFQQTFHTDNPGVDESAQSAVNNVITTTESLKMHSFTVNGVVQPPVSYILGDIFHSNPLIVGTPTNTKYFAVNLNGNNGTCTPKASSNTDTGYRCFETRHANRRKLLFVGSNDGMLHAFDAGQPHVVQAGTCSDNGAQCNDVSIATCGDPSTATCGHFSPPQYVVQFDNGSGSEAWAYMPRAVMPTVKATATGTRQFWTVDGPPQAADVFIDPFHSGAPVPSNRDWRTVLVGGLREGPENGGFNGYYALDITAPDQVDTVNNLTVPVPVANTAFPNPPNAAATLSVPACIGVVVGSNPPQTAPPATNCTSPSSPLPYPSPLWEFYDQAHNADGSISLDASGSPVRLDEDGNGRPDLGHTWSTPTIGRIQIADSGGNTIDKYVAIFGGGLDAANKTLPPPGATTPEPNAGNWLYMVDVETGSAIYKAPLVGCAPSTAAAVDTNQVGMINRIYIGTTAGHLYRVDVGPNAQGHLPQLQTVNLLGTDGKLHPEQRLIDPDSTAAPWTPREIFNTNFNGATPTTSPRPIYYSPAVIFDAKLGLYAVSFGTGDREDLWNSDPQAQRYYVFIDDTDQLSPSALPLNESSFTGIAEAAANTGVDILENSAAGHRGWFLTLEVKQVQITDSNGNAQTLNFGERVITDSFALSGINTFSTFEPEVNFAPAVKNSGQTGETCTDTGTSRIFVTFTTNGNTVLTDTANNAVRFYNEPTFVTAPYTEQAQTKNPTPGTPSSGTSELTPALASVMNTLKSLFPRNCRFGNYRIDIKAISGDTGIIFIAPVPICIIQKNWKEF
jgi:hypothetical protein